MTTSPKWQRSSHCNNGSCVDLLKLQDGSIAMRRKDDPKIILYFTKEEFKAFLAGAKSGEFDEYC